MKATGIVRRIDDLGRIVIPKELRRTFRLKEGDPLEFFTENGEIILKKYSPMISLEIVAEKYADTLYATLKKPVIICDTDRVIAIAGIPKKQLMGKMVSSMLEEVMKSQKEYRWNGKDTILLHPIENYDLEAIAAAPITMFEQLYGTVLLMGEESPKPATDEDIRILSVAAMLLEKELDD